MAVPFPSWMLAQIPRALIALLDGMALENIEDVGGAAGLVRADGYAEGHNLIDLGHKVVLFPWAVLWRAALLAENPGEGGLGGILPFILNPLIVNACFPT